MKKLILTLSCLALASCSMYPHRSSKALVKEDFITTKHSEKILDKLKSHHVNQFRSELYTLIAKESKQNVYSKLLAFEYTEFALNQYFIRENEETGKFFFRKAMKAARGSFPMQESLDDWYIPRSEFTELNYASKDLTSAINKTAHVKDPVNLAKALVAFDCWTGHRSFDMPEDTVIGPITMQGCKDNFYSAMDDLKVNVDKYCLGDEGITKIKGKIEKYKELSEDSFNFDDLKEIYTCETETFPRFISNDTAYEMEEAARNLFSIKRVNSGNYTVFFDKGHTTIPKNAVPKIQEIAAILKRNPTLNKVVLSSYTDTSGAANVNRMIAEKRALAIKDLFEQAGVSSKDIKVKAYGELETPGADGVRNKEFRKVNISLQE